MFPCHHQTVMAFLIKWIMDPLEYKWHYNADKEAIMAMTTTVIHTYSYLGRMHGVEEPDISLVPTVILEAPPMPPLAPWDLPRSPFPDIKIEPMSPELPSIEILPSLVIPGIELSPTTTPMMMDASLCTLSTIRASL